MTKRLALVLFWIAALAGAFYYVLPLRITARAQTLEWSRPIMLHNAVEWWQGMGGHLLTHYRAGFQVAQIDSATGRLQTVTDLRWDTRAAAQAIDQAAPGVLTVITIHTPLRGKGLGEVEATLRRHGWTGNLTEANRGSAVIVLSRPDAASPRRIDSVQTAPGLALEVRLPVGTTIRLRDY